MEPQTYADEVVKPGDRASRHAKQVCAGSQGNSPYVRVLPRNNANFRGGGGYTFRRDILEALARTQFNREGNITDWEMLLDDGNDGAGQKSQFFTLLNEPELWRRFGWELITMCADDKAKEGKMPTVMVNQIDTKGISDANFASFESLMLGYAEALKQAQLVNTTGEFAVMKHAITAFCDFGDETQFVMTWSGSCHGLMARDKLIDPSRIVPRLSVIGLHEHGYRCNGGGFLINLIKELLGDNLHEAIKKDASLREFVMGLTMPSISFARLFTDLVGWDPDVWPNGRPDIYGAANVTGGGLWARSKELLPPGVGMHLDTLSNPPSVLHTAQQLSVKTSRPLSDQEAYGTFHGGPGGLVVCHPRDESKVLWRARALGITATKIGETTESEDNEVLITSRFLFQTGKVLTSRDNEE